MFGLSDLQFLHENAALEQSGMEEVMGRGETYDTAHTVFTLVFFATICLVSLAFVRRHLKSQAPRNIARTPRFRSWKAALLTVTLLGWLYWLALVRGFAVVRDFSDVRVALLAAGLVCLDALAYSSIIGLAPTRRAVAAGATA